MEINKQANRLGLRFATSKGPLSTEQLWHLSVSQLDKLAVELNEQLEKSDTKSFLIQKTGKDKETQLKFDIVFDILCTKLEENEIAQKKLEDKAHNQKILELISRKQDSELEGKSIEELEALLK